jgi:hypothetical protein
MTLFNSGEVNITDLIMVSNFIKRSLPEEKSKYTNDCQIDCLEIFITLNNFLVIWWQSVCIGGRKNPDT